MTQFLPPNLLALFVPREPLPYLPPVKPLPYEKKTSGYIGVGGFLNDFEDPKDTPAPVKVETREEKLERRKREKVEQAAYNLEQKIAVWDPSGIANVTGDPFKTLFLARINYDTKESKLRREFEVYGPVKKIVLIRNTANGKPRGYAFIEYEHERDMHNAYKHADGKKIDGRRVLVDVERARTVKGWLPRRLGGGLGGTRRGGPEINVKHSGREDNEKERERYRVEREREAVRDASRGEKENRDRERRRSRDRKRRSRTRSRDRKRRRSRDREDRDRKRKRSRSKDKDRTSEKDRASERDRKKERRESRRDRKDRSNRSERPDEDVKDVRIKEEPVDDYPDYDMYSAQVKYEDDADMPEEKYRIPDQSSHDYNDSRDY